MKGSGRGGVRITLTLTIDEDGAGSRYHLVAKLAGGLLNSPVGNLVAKVLKADVNKSVSKLAQLQAA
jgi:hypothetical protein